MNLKIYYIMIKVKMKEKKTFDSAKTETQRWWQKEQYYQSIIQANTHVDSL